MSGETRRLPFGGIHPPGHRVGAADVEALLADRLDEAFLDQDPVGAADGQVRDPGAFHQLQSGRQPVPRLVPAGHDALPQLISQPFVDVPALGHSARAVCP